ncbi:unnamed protein product [Candida verbasci]|uniref:Uncharacterized protein n=1 Tax=Candida verbasci TaxID=1227364 RepID=A0A9W4TSG7_9ASCO|nr:unnamed protein product [Candida verbasci]
MFEECIGCSQTRYKDEPMEDKMLVLCPICRLTRYYKASKDVKIFENFNNQTKLYAFKQLLSTHRKKLSEFEDILLQDEFMSKFKKKKFDYAKELLKIENDQQSSSDDDEEEEPEKDEEDDCIEEEDKKDEPKKVEIVQDDDDESSDSSSSENDENEDMNMNKEEKTKNESSRNGKARLRKKPKLESSKSKSNSTKSSSDRKCGGCKRIRSKDEPPACKTYLNCPKCVIKRRMGNHSKNPLHPSIKLYALKQVEEMNKSHQMVSFKEKMLNYDEFLSQFKNKKFDYKAEMKKLGL